METFRLRLHRFDPKHDSAPRYEEYEIESDGPLSLMQAICRVYDTVDGTLSLRNTDCRRGVCGICSMMIDGRRRLACTCVAQDGMTIGPPPNRKVIKDLVFEMD
jgi:succinate dehydrogenase/fumarate reductase-like Fe-S protein